MAVNQMMGVDVQSALPQVGGGVVGVGAPAVLRETMDVQNGQPFSLVGSPGSIQGRLTRPSVAWGLGVGGLTGVLWALDVGPSDLQDFYLAHTLTAIPTGALSALLPKEASASTAGARSSPQRAMRDTGSTSNGPSANGEFAPSGGTSVDTQPAN